MGWLGRDARFWLHVGAGAALAAALIAAPYFLSRGRLPGQASPGSILRSLASDRAPSRACSDFYRWACAEHVTLDDPTGRVMRDAEAELAALRIYEDLTRSKPGSEIDAALAAKLFEPRRVERVRVVYEWVKHSLLDWIQGLPANRVSPKLKATLLARVKSVTLALPLPPEEPKPEEPELLTKSGAYYERSLDGSLRIRLGGAYALGTTSLFNLTYTLAHEFAHAIDPCELQAAHVAAPAFRELGECFIRRGIIPRVPASKRCLAGDQESEAFADWVAAELVTRRLYVFAREFDAQQLHSAVANSVRDLCPQGEALRDFDHSVHPRSETRIETLFGRQPALRELLGCPGAQDKPYCTL